MGARFPPDAAEKLLQTPQDQWTADVIEKTHSDLQAMDALLDPLNPRECITGELWTKTRRGGKPSRRLGSTPLMLKKLALNYDTKLKRLTGTLLCGNLGEILCD